MRTVEEKKLDGRQAELICKCGAKHTSALLIIDRSILTSFVKIERQALLKSLLSELYQYLSTHSSRNLTISCLIISMTHFHYLT